MSFAVVSALFTLMLKWLPDAEVTSATCGWVVSHGGTVRARKVPDQLLHRQQGLESTYGASASVVVVLIWIYYTAQFVLCGAEFTHLRARQRGGDGQKTKIDLNRLLRWDEEGLQLGVRQGVDDYWMFGPAVAAD